MKKSISLLLIATLALSLLSLTGCHGRRALDPFVMPDELDTSREIEISFWAKNDTNQTQVNVYRNAISAFEKAYPSIKVSLKLYNDYGRIYSDVITNITTDTTPNVCITYPDHIATYMTGKNVIVPLDSLMGDEKYGLGGSEVNFDSVKADEIVPEFLAECVIGENHYALPYMRSTEACYVNKTYVEALGYTLPPVLTWDFIWEVSEAALAKNPDGTYKVNGQKTLIPFIYKSTDNMMIQMVKQKGAGYSNENGEILLFNDDVKDILFTVSEHAETRAFSTFKISSYPANFLNAGQCIFAIDSTAGATWMGSSAPNIDIPDDKLVKFETAVMTVPQYDTENPVMISQGPSMCIFNKLDSQEVLASWLFMQFLLTDEVQFAYSTTEGYVPVTTKAQNSEDYKTYLSGKGEISEGYLNYLFQDGAPPKSYLTDGGDFDKEAFYADFYYKTKLEATELLIENTENTFVTPVFNGSASLRNAAGQLIEEVTKAERRGKDVNDKFIKDLYREMISLYKLNRPIPKAN